ncbi:MAG: Dabb family protein [Ferruginibacter sp.]
MRKMMILCMLAAISVNAVSAQPSTDKLLRHVVLFKFKDAATAANVKVVEDAFLLLPSKMNLIKDFEWGTNTSPEKLNDGLTHCFFVTFASEKDRDDYLVHPAHQAFVDVLKPFLDKAVVVDFWAKQ